MSGDSLSGQTILNPIMSNIRSLS